MNHCGPPFTRDEPTPNTTRRISLRQRLLRNTAVVSNERSQQLYELAQRVADALPADVAEEVVLTGSVSRGVADDVSDIEMLIVTPGPLDLAACFEHGRAAGLRELGTWGAQGTPTERVSGSREGVPLELIWWSREYAESSIDAIFAGETSSAADAIANGLALRARGLLSQWIEQAALTWGGFAAAGLLSDET